MTKIFSFITFIVMFFGVSSQVALATDVNTSSSSGPKVEDIMCKAYSIFNGPLGKTFAVFAIVALGVGFFLGKVSWGTAIAIALGIGAIFGAPALVGTLLGGTFKCDINGAVDTKTNV